MQIDILHVPHCPNVEPIRSRLRTALDATGVRASVSEIEVATPEAAANAGMRGSPTVLLDGRDPFPSPNPSALSCRLYPGGSDGAPSVAQLIDALTS